MGRVGQFLVCILTLNHRCACLLWSNHASSSSSSVSLSRLRCSLVEVKVLAASLTLLLSC